MDPEAVPVEEASAEAGVAFPTPTKQQIALAPKAWKQDDEEDDIDAFEKTAAQSV
jgi:hypothetical protein